MKRVQLTAIPMIMALGSVLAGRLHFDTPKDDANPGSGGAATPPADAITTLRAEFARLHKEGTAVVEGAVKASRDLTPEEKSANETRFNRMKAIKVTLEERGKFASLKLADEPTTAGKVELPTDAPGKDEFQQDASRGRIVVGETKIDKDEFGRAVSRWMANGEMDRKFATITTSTASSILLPKQVITPINVGAMNTFREGYGAWGLQPMQTIGNAATINIPVIDPTAGGVVAENASSETENAPSMSESITSTVKTYQSGSVWFSNLVLAANSIDMLNAIVPNLRFNKELGLESAIAAAIIADSGITQSVATATITGFTYANSVSLSNKLPKRYQMLKVRLLSAEAYAAAEGLVDDNNRPIMVMDTQNQNLRKMHGTPTFRCDYLEAFGANKVVGLEVSLVGFHLRDAGEGLARYTQNQARPDQVGTNLFGYHAYGYAASAITKFKCPAS